jgi:hypothetical protein
VTRRAFSRAAVLFVLVTLGGFSLASAAEDGTVKVHGKIMAVDARKNTMIVNERVFAWDQKTSVHNEKGSPTRVERFNEKTYVYIVGEQEGEGKRVLIRKIYLLPKRVEKKDRHLYPFMQ